MHSSKSEPCSVTAKFSLPLYLLVSHVTSVTGKGTGVISASGGSSEGVCVDCGSADKDGEMECAIIILCLILLLFFLILACQCTHRFLFEFSASGLKVRTDHMNPMLDCPPPETKGMPPPPYHRQNFTA
ncbi:hypothetical protein HDE_07942 [Halotydeus destructor]|nr:hypothetical protein HDE_07942 [Halotydeus destructor]